MRSLKSRPFLVSVVAVVLLLAACGEGEEDTSVAVTPAEETEDTDSDTQDDGEQPADDSDGSDGEDMISVSSLDDIPQSCKDLMEGFLKDIEPTVSPIDWDNATIADFETIATEFEARAEQFDTDTEANTECDNLDMEDEQSFDLMIEFAEDKAPGTVGFLMFVDSFATAAVDAMDGTGAEGGFETCDDAIAFMDGLMENYGSMDQVPVSDLTAMTSVVSVIFTCTPEQMAYFDQPEVNAFFEDFFG